MIELKKIKKLKAILKIKIKKKPKKKEENKRPRVWAKVAQYTWAFINKLKQVHISLVYLFFKVHITLFLKTKLQHITSRLLF
jgi:hypothetical protein